MLPTRDDQGQALLDKDEEALLRQPRCNSQHNRANQKSDRTKPNKTEQDWAKLSPQRECRRLPTQRPQLHRLLTGNPIP